MTARILIATPEPALRAQLRDLLEAAWPRAEPAVFAADALEALRAIEHDHPDAMFLDLPMPGPSPLACNPLANGRCPFVIVAASDEFAAEAFQHGAVDYLLKPLRPDRVAAAVMRVRRRLNGGAIPVEAAAANGERYLRWIIASKGDGVQLIATDTIRYFQSDSKYTRVVAREREGLIRRSIRELTSELDPGTFWQVHRATIVNLHHVESVARDEYGHVVLRMLAGDEVLPVSQPYAHLFRQM